MNHRTAFACLKTARKCYASDSRRETFVAVAFVGVALFILSRYYGAVRRIFKEVGGDGSSN